MNLRQKKQPFAVIAAKAHFIRSPDLAAACGESPVRAHSDRCCALHERPQSDQMGYSLKKKTTLRVHIMNEIRPLVYLKFKP